jgi:hypothetical protein
MNENQPDMDSLRNLAKLELNAEKMENAHSILRDLTDISDAICKNLGSKVIVEALSELMKKKVDIISARYSSLESKFNSAVNELNRQATFRPVTEYDKNNNTMLKNPVGSSFYKADKERNDEFLKKLFDEGKDINGFDKMDDSEKALAILEKETKESSNKETLNKFETKLKELNPPKKNKSKKGSKKEKK